MKRILIADAHKATREFITQFLSTAGFEVLASESAKEGFELYAAKHPDAVIVAADLAKSENEHLAQRLRKADPKLILIVTDKGHLGKAKGVHSVLDLRANAYIPDPTKKELLERVQQLLSQAEAARPATPRAAAQPSQQGIGATLAQTPVAQGELREGVLGRVLTELWKNGGDGVVAVLQRETTRHIYLLKGAPVNFDSDIRAESLGRWLVETKQITEDQYLEALNTMAGGTLSAGAALVATGALEPGDPLYQTLHRHVRVMIGRCVGLRDGRWRFHPGSEFVSQIQALEMPPLAPILEGARNSLPLKFFSDELKPVMRAYPARTSEFSQLLPAMALGTSELRLALNLSGRASTRDFLEGRRSDLKEAYTILWFLSTAGAIAFHPAAVETVDDARYVDVAGASRKKKALPAETGETLRQAVLRILPGSYFKALGLDIASDVNDVERAYHELAMRFHPDNFTQYDMGDLEDLLSQVQDKINAAYRVLSVEEKRKAYLGYLLSRSGTVGESRLAAGIDVDAEIAMKRGEKAMRGRRFTEACDAFRDAADRRPKEPDYAAMLAFAILKDPSLPAADRPKAALKAAKKALALDKNCVRALVAMALAEEAGGALPEARKHALGALKIAPNSEVAKRALQKINRAKR